MHSELFTEYIDFPFFMVCFHRTQYTYNIYYFIILNKGTTECEQKSIKNHHVWCEKCYLCCEECNIVTGKHCSIL